MAARRAAAGQDTGSNKRQRGAELENRRYIVMDPVGEGAYGVVCKAQDTQTNRMVAIKKIRSNVDSEGISASALREISLLKELKHSNLVQLIDVYQRNNRYHLVLEWLTSDLKKYMENLKPRRCLSKVQVRDFTRQLLEGLDYCHSHAVLHRDLKPQNLLINEQGILKIADFGLARAFSIPMRQYTHEVVTLWYRAPEILLGTKKYSTAIDMWSVGCIVAEMCDMKALWTGDSEIDQLFRIFRSRGTPTEELWPNVENRDLYPDFSHDFPNWPRLNIDKLVDNPDILGPQGLDLLDALFRYDPNTRITARAALSHEYLTMPLDKVRRQSAAISSASKENREVHNLAGD